MSFDVKWTALLLMLTADIAVKGRLDVNVALNRPSFSSGVYKTYPPSNANDGDKVNCERYGAGGESLVITEDLLNAWVMIDLGVPLYLDGVRLTNRADDFGYRSDNFIIGLMNAEPDMTAPTTQWTYDVCGQYPGTVPDGATVTLKCKYGMAAYRYVFIQRPNPGHAGKVNFCELEVFVHRWHYKATTGYRMINKDVSTFHVEHRVHCLANCTMSPVCDSYNYRAADKTCQFNTHDTPLIANSVDIVADSAWSWFSTTFTVVV